MTVAYPLTATRHQRQSCQNFPNAYLKATVNYSHSSWGTTLRLLSLLWYTMPTLHLSPSPGPSGSRNHHSIFQRFPYAYEKTLILISGLGLQCVIYWCLVPSSLLQMKGRCPVCGQIDCYVSISHFFFHTFLCWIHSSATANTNRLGVEWSARHTIISTENLPICEMARSNGRCGFVLFCTCVCSRRSCANPCLHQKCLAYHFPLLDSLTSIV